MYVKRNLVNQHWNFFWFCFNCDVFSLLFHKQIYLISQTLMKWFPNPEEVSSESDWLSSPIPLLHYFDRNPTRQYSCSTILWANQYKNQGKSLPVLINHPGPWSWCVFFISHTHTHTGAARGGTPPYNMGCPGPSADIALFYNLKTVVKKSAPQLLKVFLLYTCWNLLVVSILFGSVLNVL